MAALIASCRRRHATGAAPSRAALRHAREASTSPGPGARGFRTSSIHAGSRLGVASSARADRREHPRPLLPSPTPAASARRPAPPFARRGRRLVALFSLAACRHAGASRMCSRPHRARPCGHLESRGLGIAWLAALWPRIEQLREAYGTPGPAREPCARATRLGRIAIRGSGSWPWHWRADSLDCRIPPQQFHVWTSCFVHLAHPHAPRTRGRRLPDSLRFQPPM